MQTPRMVPLTLTYSQSANRLETLGNPTITSLSTATQHCPRPRFTHPCSCKLFKVVHFFQTSMFFLIVPSPLERKTFKNLKLSTGRWCVSLTNTSHSSKITKQILCYYKYQLENNLNSHYYNQLSISVLGTLLIHLSFYY